MYMVKIPAVSKDELLKDWDVAISEDSTAYEYSSQQAVKKQPHTHSVGDLFELRMQHIWLRMQHSCSRRYSDSLFLSRFGHAIDTDILSALQQGGYNVTLPITSAITLMQQRIAERGVGLCLTTTSQ